MFPEHTFDMVMFNSIPYEDVICNILLPEATVHLIQQDLSVDQHKAENTCDASVEFGHIYHSSDNNSIINNLITKTTKVIRQEEAWYVKQEEFGSTKGLGFVRTIEGNQIVYVLND
jgi:hypothetical protein